MAGGLGFWRWPRVLRLASYVAAGLAVLLVAVVLAVVHFVRAPLPQTTGELDLPGLEDPVRVVRDDAGISQLYGDSLDDLMRAQGYVHAQERFFEMDVRRHATAGRLAEMFGEDAVASDELVRTMGWRRVASRELALVSPATRAALQAYADGVNAYLDSHTPSEIAVEYTVLNAGGLDYTPEQWTPVDSLAWLKAMAWDLRGNMTDEIDRVLARAGHTAREVAQLYPPYDYADHAPIVAGGAVVGGTFQQQAPAAAARPAYPAAARGALAGLRDSIARMPALVGHGDGLGSNSWVVDGDHTDSGGPLLANDPHLGTSLPGVWMQMGLHCRTVTDDCPLDVAGFTFSGVPGVIIGHNADIAWGFTNLGPDVSDLYLEKVEGDRWRYDGRWRPLRTHRETIEVADGEDRTITVRSTAHGPLLSDVADDYADLGDSPPGVRPGRYAVSLAWTALRPSRTADALLGIDSAGSWAEFRRAARSFAVPAQNLVYADRAGHIGYQAPGLVPIRRRGNDGTMPSAGWRPEDDWTGRFVPFDALPSVLDPERGFVVTANQALTGPGYPVHLTGDWDQGYRSQRITDLLQQQLDGDGSVSADDMLAIQLDDLNPLAAELVPYLLTVDLPRGYYAAGQWQLRRWDFHQDADSPGAAYFNVVWRNLLALTFHDELPEDAWPDGGDRWFAVVTRLLRQPDSPWWDDRTTDVRETRDDVLRQAMEDARDELTRRQALDSDDWTWGHLHRLDLHSPTLGESGIGLVERLVNRDGWEVGGGSSAVDAAAWDAAQGYGVVSAPSMRMVVSPADWDASRWINLTGVSGHPFDPHYTDQTDRWVRGETLPWTFTPDAVERAAEDVLTLEPAADGAHGG
ncbi:penicillin acylase family protein [Nocardioides sp.]|uniref:penicillin acylase family protein n=1 Tax=Nocardioides sp. TaxID=35761 RepID=UPI003782D672